MLEIGNNFLLVMVMNEISAFAKRAKGDGKNALLWERSTALELV